MRSTEKVPFICEKHGEYWQKLNKHQMGQRCPKCAIEKRSITYRKTPYDLTDVREDYQEKVKQGKISAHTKIPFICKKHGEYWQSIANHYNKHTGCPKCGDESCSEKRRKYSPVLNAKNYGVFTCKIHGKYLQTFDKHYNAKYGCPLCAKASKISSSEKDLRKFIEALKIPNIIYNDRTIIAPQELDIYIPDKHVAIEYNGNYWHSDLNKNKMYHLNKYKLCAEKNIRLIQVWEYEWYDDRKRPIMESIIKSALGIYDKKLDARKCELIILPSKDVQTFLNDNNLGGKRNGQKAFCLKYENEIVQCMLLSKSSFYKKNPPYEIIRAATKRNTQVRGGTSKLLKAIKNYVGDEKLVYFVELDHFNGKWLANKNSGFVFEKMQPTIKVWYVNDNVVKNRNSYHYKEFLELYKVGAVHLLYTAGTAKYVFNA